MKAILHVFVVGLLIVAVVANTGLGAGIVAAREPAPRPLTPERIETASRPAIVLVQSNYTLSASLAGMVIPDAKYNQIVDKIQAMWNAGQLTSNAQAYRAAINLVISNPAAYFGPGPVSKGGFDLVSTGSGFFVTEDGYLVTAAHVVSADKSELRNRAVAVYSEPDEVATDKPNLAAGLLGELGLAGSGVSLTAAQQDKLEAYWQGWVAKYLTIDKIDVKYYLGSGVVETGDRLTGTGARASVVSIDPTTTGHDIAVLKAAVAGVPTLALEEGSPRMGQATYAIGYPRLGYLDEAVPLNQTIPATMSTGTVMLTDTRSTGWTAWGTTAALTHGDSGGPVIDARGAVVGIVSYSRVDSNGNQVYGGGFFVPSEYIRADLAADSVVLRDAPTNLTNTYYHALAEADIQRYKVELPLLQSIESRSPFDAYVKDDITSVLSQILTGKDRTPPDLAAYIPYAAAAAAGTIALALIAWLSLALTAFRVRRPLPAVEPQVAAVGARLENDRFVTPALVLEDAVSSDAQSPAT